MLYDDGELTYSVDENVSFTLSLALVQRIVLNIFQAILRSHWGVEPTSGTSSGISD